MRMLCALPGITELLTVSISLQGVYRHKVLSSTLGAPDLSYISPIR